VLIFIIDFTKWRPIATPDFINAKAVNGAIISLSFSYLAAAIFYLVLNYIPERPRRKASRAYIEYQLWDIQENLRQLVEFVPTPFSFERKKYTIETLAEAYEQLDFYNKPFGKLTLHDYVESYRANISSISYCLMSSYSQYMTSREIEYIEAILDSYFIRYKLVPKDFSIPEEDQCGYYGAIGVNQREYGESIYKIYSYNSNTYSSLKTFFARNGIKRFTQHGKKYCRWKAEPVTAFLTSISKCRV
jgi:hypothetical protein